MQVSLIQGSSSVPTVYMQGQNYSGTTAITAAITATATGYTNGTGTASLYPTGLYIATGSFSTTTFSPATGVAVYLTVLTPGSLTNYGAGYPLNPQATPIPFSITSGTTNVGTISGSPATIPAGIYYNNSSITFTPLTAGTSTLTLTEPAGYYTPSSLATQITATVTP